MNRFETTRGPVFAKRQCLHCWQPACVAACLTKAMHKTRAGPVVWRADQCMGCRFCMISCPFNIPKFEYHDWNPRIEKCSLCFERLQAGGKPACERVLRQRTSKPGSTGMPRFLANEHAISAVLLSPRKSSITGFPCGPPPEHRLASIFSGPSSSLLASRS